MKLIQLCFISLLLIQPVLLFGQGKDSLSAKDSVTAPKLITPDSLVSQAKQLEAKPKVAIALYKKALATKTEAFSPNWEGDVRVSIARLLFETENSKQAFEELLTAQTIFSQSANTHGQLDVVNEMAVYYEKKKDFKEAERYLGLVLKLQEIAGLTKDIPNTNFRLGDIYFRKKEYTKAAQFLTSALNEYELTSQKEKTGIAYVLLADIKRRQKGFPEAEKLILKRALPAFSAVDSKQGRIDCFNLLGQMYYDERRFSEAKWFFIQSNTQYRNLNDATGIITSLVNLAKVKSAIGDNKSALKDFKEAETLARKKKNQSLVAYVKSAYGKYYNKRIKVAPSKVTSSKTPVKKVMAKASDKPVKESKPVVVEN